MIRYFHSVLLKVTMTKVGSGITTLSLGAYCLLGLLLLFAATNAHAKTEKFHASLIRKDVAARASENPDEQKRLFFSLQQHGDGTVRYLQEEEDENVEDEEDDDDNSNDDTDGADDDVDGDDDDDNDNLSSDEGNTGTVTAASIETFVSTNAMVERGPSSISENASSSDGRRWNWNLGPLCVVGAAGIALIVSLIALEQRKKKKRGAQPRSSMGDFTPDVVNFYLRDPELDLSTVATLSTATSLSSKALGGV